MAFWSTPDQRPQKVVWFEVISILLLIADAFDSVGGRAPTWFVMLFVLLMLWLILSISRRRSNVARWIFTVFLAAFILLLIYDLATHRMESGVFNLAEIRVVDWLLGLGTMLQLWLLSSADTRRWIASKRRAEGAEI
ncbi:MAG TPA: hypothetical protein VGR19_04995 [Allosphingosinicella sp.]|nr:hypothetical protein [Allosphingosinicella sp.]